jgi:hypothetical protein
MTDYEHSIAREVRALLIPAHPQPTDVNLAGASEICSRRALHDRPASRPFSGRNISGHTKGDTGDSGCERRQGRGTTFGRHYGH